jgi:hypothetical protein
VNPTTVAVAETIPQPNTAIWDWNRFHTRWKFGFVETTIECEVGVKGSMQGISVFDILERKKLFSRGTEAKKKAGIIKDSKR